MPYTDFFEISIAQQAQDSISFVPWVFVLVLVLFHIILITSYDGPIY